MAILDLITIGNQQVIIVDIAPDIVGVDAPVGSLIMMSDGSGTYIKTNTGLTDWVRQVTTTDLSAATGSQTLSQVLTNGNSTGDISITSIDTFSRLLVESGAVSMRYDSGVTPLSYISTGNGYIALESENSSIFFSSNHIQANHTTEIQLNAPSVTKNGIEIATVNDIIAYTASNGLTQSGGNIKLGGSLTENTTINANNNDFIIDNLNTDSMNSKITDGDGNGLWLGKGYMALSDWTDFGITEIGAGSGTASWISLKGNGGTDGNIDVRVSGGPRIQMWKESASHTVADGSTNNTMVISDNGNNKGLVYIADYSANFSLESLVSKRYVDASVASASNVFTNGLTASAGVVKLGGALTESTFIDGSHQLLFGFNTPLSEYSVITSNNSKFAKLYLDDSSSELSYVSATGSTAVFRSNENTTRTFVSIGGNISSFDINYSLNATIVDNGTNNTIVVKDELTNKGIVYASDYSANFTPESLVSKRYVDTNIAGLTATYIQLSEKAQPNGVATLDNGGKIPIAQLPNSVMQYQGQWDASTNTPTLADGTGDAGDVYEVVVAGTANFGSGDINFKVGDWAVYNGTIWDKSINSNEVVSVNGLTGAVNIGLSSVLAISNSTGNYDIVSPNLYSVLDVQNSHAQLSFDNGVSNSYLFLDGTFGVELSNNGTDTLLINNGNATITTTNQIELTSPYLFSNNNYVQFDVANDFTVLSSSASFAGILYGADYSANFIDESLVSKRYVDNQIGSAGLTFSNGITKTGSDVKLGGTLTEVTYIDGNQSLIIGQNTPLPLFSINVLNNSNAANFLLDDSFAELSYVGSTGNTALFRATENTVRAIAAISGLDASLNINYSALSTIADNGTNNILVVRDQVSSKGIIYASDYSANFTPESLVSKRYVDANIAAAGLTATNGLTQSGADIKLGGDLTENTTIDGLSTFGLTLNNLDQFTVNSFNNIDLFASSQTLYAQSSIDLISDSLFHVYSNSATINASYSLEMNVGSGGFVVDTSANASIGQLNLYSGSSILLSASTNITSIATGYQQISSGNSTVIIDMYDTIQPITNNGTDNAFVVTDSLANKGIVYASDYSANFTPESLVSKRYVDASVASASNVFTNGLTASAGVVKLGGALTENTTINANNNVFIINNLNTDSGNSKITDGDGNGLWLGKGYMALSDWTDFGTTEIGAGSGTASWISINGNGGTSGNIDVRVSGGPRIQMWKESASHTVADGSTNNTMVISDNGNNKGLVYIADYSANFTPESLVSKRYVDSAINNQVIAITGSTDRITVTGTTSSTIDIAATYAGQTSITTVGTVSTGVWNATPIDDAYIATPYIKADGTRQLTGNWTAGAYSADFNGVVVGSVANTIDLAVAGTMTLGSTNTTTLNIANTANSVINIGSSTSIVNILGTASYVNTTNTNVLDSLITLNKGGAAASATNTGIEIEENSVITGYIKTTGTRDGYQLLAPANANSLTFALTDLTANRTVTLPDYSGTPVLKDYVYKNDLTTTDNTTTTIKSIATVTGESYMVVANIMSKKTAGAGTGTVGDSNAYIRTFKVKNIGGTVTLSAIQSDFTSEDIIAHNVTFTVSGTNVLLQVVGSNNNTVNWTANTEIIKL